MSPKAVTLASLLAAALHAADGPTTAQLEFFEREIRPVLADNCFECHGPKKQKSGLRLDSRELVLKGGEIGPVVVPGKPEQSRLIIAVRHAGGKEVAAMPSDDKRIPEKAVAALTEWVRQGLPWPKEAGPAISDPRAHWAFQPVGNPAVPQPKDPSRARNEVDRFLMSGLDAAGLAFAPEASREVLARRAYFVLHGLQPTEADIAAFVHDADPLAYEKLVDRLMAAPAFGERWARHWLDVARYADTKGYVFQEERRYPYAYTYRDWVVNAFNRDLPYDQFLRLQIAADQIVQGADTRDLAAMGFLTLGRRFLNNTHDIIDDRIDVVMRGTQGLTVGCARCHDHKFDPIPTTDYYSLHAIFNSSEEPAEKPLLLPFTPTEGTKAFEVELAKRQAKLDDFIRSRRENSYNAEKTAGYLTLVIKAHLDGKLDSAQEAKRANLYVSILQGWRKVLQGRLKESDPIWGGWLLLARASDSEFPAKYKALLADPARFADPTLRAELARKPPTKFSELTGAYAQVLAESRKPGQAERKELAGWISLLRAPDGPESPTAQSLVRTYNVADRNTRNKLEVAVEGFKATSPDAPPRAMALQDKARPVQGVVLLRGSPSRQGRKVPRQFLEILSQAPRKEYTQGSGRRELADSVASTANPLTARVLVNRAWGHVFGQHLVDTPSDFGVRTPKPAQAALLDHLCRTFMDDGWSIKRLVRRMVVSAAFRQSVVQNPTAYAKDPENHLYWSMNRRRLDFESMRDSILQAAGRLDGRLGGLPFDLIKDFSNPRRTLYSHIDRQNLPSLYRTFDFANPDYHVARRNLTTTPQQALWLMNHPFTRQQADALAARVANQTDPAAKTAALYRLTLGRAPTNAEVSAALEFLAMGGKEPPPASWLSGFGNWDDAARKMRFTPMAHLEKDRHSPEARYPGTTSNFVSVTSKGGHPGTDVMNGSIRRWSSGGGGEFQIEGDVLVTSKNSRGVRVRVATDRQGVIGEWLVPGAIATPVRLPKVKLASGEEL
ncbi:MAG: PSD1 and planctomycete cytochrome C domain-containing protein, partial [Opitutales bacterium]